MFNWIVTILEFLLDHTPILGKLKNAIERDYADRPLTYGELITTHWLEKTTDFLNRAFREPGYDQPYKADQLRDWLTHYPGAFTVLVRKKLAAWPVGSEVVVASVKILPLKENIVLGTGFDPQNVTGEQLADNEASASAVWVGDLVSTNQQMLLLLLAVRNKLTGLRSPIYCRTSNRRLRTILFERYGARVVEPTGGAAGAATILVFTPPGETLAAVR
jgi:hypothetical protein